MRSRVVTIAGGTGGYPLLRGLSRYDLDLTGIFSPFDTGGSSGDLRLEFGGPSWGDIRRGLQALSSQEEPFRSVAQLSEFRFPEGSRLRGHNLGNILLLSLALQTGDARKGLVTAERLFGLPRGRHVLPSTFESSDIIIELEDGRKIVGGRKLAHEIGFSRIRGIHLNPHVAACSESLRALKNADMIIVGPGSTFNSILPNLLVGGIREAIKQSKATVVFVCNTVTEARETDLMKGSDFVKLVSKYLGFVPHFSLFSSHNNTGKRRYESHRGGVEVDAYEIERAGTVPVLARVVDKEYVDRHDEAKLAKVITRLLDERRHATLEKKSA